MEKKNNYVNMDRFNLYMGEWIAGNKINEELLMVELKLLVDMIINKATGRGDKYTENNRLDIDAARQDLYLEIFSKIHNFDSNKGNLFTYCYFVLRNCSWRYTTEYYKEIKHVTLQCDLVKDDGESFDFSEIGIEEEYDFFNGLDFKKFMDYCKYLFLNAKKKNTRKMAYCLYWLVSDPVNMRKIATLTTELTNRHDSYRFLSIYYSWMYNTYTKTVHIYRYVEEIVAGFKEYSKSCKRYIVPPEIPPLPFKETTIFEYITDSLISIEDKHDIVNTMLETKLPLSEIMKGGNTLTYKMKRSDIKAYVRSRGLYNELKHLINR